MSPLPSTVEIKNAKQLCSFCGSNKSITKYDYGENRIVKCTQCSLMFLTPMPTLEDIRNLYSESYYRNEDFYSADHHGLFGYSDYAAERFNKQREYYNIVSDIKSFISPLNNHPPSLLEVGCGFGYFLDVAHDQGFQVTGLEFNPFAVKRIRQKYSFPIHEGSLSVFSQSPHSFNVITLFDVIEHLYDPFKDLELMNNLLKTEGILVLSTMDSESITSRILGKRLEDFRRTREHLYFFSRKSMTKILNKCGFEVMDIRSIGHTFEIGMLLERVSIYVSWFFKPLLRLIKTLGIDKWNISINPHTKMIVYAKKVKLKK